MGYSDTEIRYILDSDKYMDDLWVIAKDAGLPATNDWGICIQTYKSTHYGYFTGYRIVIIKGEQQVTSTTIRDDNPNGWFAQRAVRKAAKRAIKLAA